MSLLVIFTLVLVVGGVGMECVVPFATDPSSGQTTPEAFQFNGNQSWETSDITWTWLDWMKYMTKMISSVFTTLFLCATFNNWFNFKYTSHIQLVLKNKNLVVYPAIVLFCFLCFLFNIANDDDNNEYFIVQIGIVIHWEWMTLN